MGEQPRLAIAAALFILAARGHAIRAIADPRYDGISPFTLFLWAVGSAFAGIQCWAWRDLLDIALVAEQAESQSGLLSDIKRELQQSHAHDQAQGEFLADIEAELRRHHAAVESGGSGP